MQRVTAEQFKELTKTGKKSKWRNRPVKTSEGVFDSQAEYDRWCELKILQSQGEIRKLEHHKVFEIRVGGHLICKYESDFVYEEQTSDPNVWTPIVEDVKGSKETKTPEYKLKAKLMFAVHKITIRETFK